MRSLRNARTRAPYATLSAIMALTLTACFGLGSGPESVAEEFWQAAMDGDRDRVMELSVEAHDTDMDFDDQDTEIRRIEIGGAEIDGDLAEVETTIEAGGEELILEADFHTVLVREDGDWLVDLDETGKRLVGAMIGASMQELGDAIGEGLGEAMEGLAEGLAEGMEEAGRALEEAAEEMRENRDR